MQFTQSSNGPAAQQHVLGKHVDSLSRVSGQRENPGINDQHGQWGVSRQHAAASSSNQRHKGHRDVATQTWLPPGPASSGMSQVAAPQIWPATHHRRSTPSWTPSSEHPTPDAATYQKWQSHGTTLRSIATAANPSPPSSQMQADTNLRLQAAQRRAPSQTSQDCSTTLIIRNIPAHYTTEKLLEEWVPDSTFNLVHLPWDIRKRQYRGFAFINFLTNQHAWAFVQRWMGRKLRDHGGAHPLDINFAKVQGLTAIIDHLRSQHCGRMQARRFLPAVFLGTVRVDFGQLMETLDAQNAEVMEHRDLITEVEDGTPWWQDTRPHEGEICARWSC